MLLRLYEVNVVENPDQEHVYSFLHRQTTPTPLARGGPRLQHTTLADNPSPSPQSLPHNSTRACRCCCHYRTITAISPSSSVVDLVVSSIFCCTSSRLSPSLPGATHLSRNCSPGLDLSSVQADRPLISTSVNTCGRCRFSSRWGGSFPRASPTFDSNRESVDTRSPPDGGSGSGRGHAFIACVRHPTKTTHPSMRGRWQGKCGMTR